MLDHRRIQCLWGVSQNQDRLINACLTKLDSLLQDRNTVGVGNIVQCPGDLYRSMTVGIRLDDRHQLCSRFSEFFGIYDIFINRIQINICIYSIIISHCYLHFFRVTVYVYVYTTSLLFLLFRQDLRQHIKQIAGDHAVPSASVPDVLIGSNAVQPELPLSSVAFPVPEVRRSCQSAHPRCLPWKVHCCR